MPSYTVTQTIASDPETRRYLEPAREVVLHKGYHRTETVRDLREDGLRTYVSEPTRGGRRWGGKTNEREAVYANRRRERGRYGKKLMRQRAELIERSFAHCYETGAMRRPHLRYHSNILKRLLIHVRHSTSASSFANTGFGTPRGLQERAGKTTQGVRNALARGLHAIGHAILILAGHWKSAQRQTGYPKTLCLPSNG